MWLIDTKTFKLRQFVGRKIPDYAIVSHTWGKREIDFNAWVHDFRTASQKPAFAKIQSACIQAQTDGLKYLWIDTICIDKSNSADLSEAINSMFAWYHNSSVCYIHLADVDDTDGVADKLGDLTELEFHKFLESSDLEELGPKERLMDSIWQSRWFTRGWTLQELIAPKSILVFTQDWKPILMQYPQEYEEHGRSSKLGQGRLLRLFTPITGIKHDALTYPEVAMSCSNAEKMSWMAGRKTNRTEDVAYSLLGLFNVKMPLVYGEGIKAFHRLQVEIMKQTTDHSLFGWQWPAGAQFIGDGTEPNILADSPLLFSNLNHIDSNSIPRFQVDGDVWEAESSPQSVHILVANYGISLNLELIPTANPMFVFASLNNATSGFRDREMSADRELWCIPFERTGAVFNRAPFPPGPFPIRTQRRRRLLLVDIPRDQLLYGPRGDYQFAFVMLFPNLKLDHTYRVTCLDREGEMQLMKSRSSVYMPRNGLQNGNAASIALRFRRGPSCSFILYIEALMINDRVETSARLFPANTTLETIRQSRQNTVWHPSSFYWDEMGPFSLVVSKGHCVDPLPGESSSGTIYSISLFTRPRTTVEEGEEEDAESNLTIELDSEESDSEDSNGKESNDEEGNGLEHGEQECTAAPEEYETDMDMS